VRQRPWGDADALADRPEILLQLLVATDEVGEQVPVQIHQVVALQLDRRVDVVLVRPLGIELVAQERVEIRQALDEMRPLAAQVMPRADLQIPGVAHDGELEQPLEQLRRKHFLRRHDARMARDLGRDSVPGQVREAVADPHRVIQRVAPAQRRQGRAHARAAGLGDVHEQEVVAVGQKHAEIPGSFADAWPRGAVRYRFSLRCNAGTGRGAPGRHVCR